MIAEIATEARFMPRVLPQTAFPVKPPEWRAILMLQCTLRRTPMSRRDFSRKARIR
jgi:hypothetical protein